MTVSYMYISLFMNVDSIHASTLIPIFIVEIYISVS